VAKHQEDRQRQVQAFAVALTYDMVRFLRGPQIAGDASGGSYRSSANWINLMEQSDGNTVTVPVYPYEIVGVR